MPTRINAPSLPRSGGGDSTVFVSGPTWDMIMDRLEALEGVFSPEDFEVKQGKDGKQVRLRAGAGGAAGSAGAFCKRFLDDETWMLLGGVVSGGDGNITVPDIDMGAVDTPPADGTYYWLSISFTATTEDEVLLPGGDVTAATVASGVSLPSNIIPTAAAPAGTLQVSLGVWSQGKFIPSGCGNIPVSHCPGSLTASRS